MRMIPILLLFAAAALSAFAWWGLCTRAGKARFDEMAGMIPLAAGALSLVLLLGAAALAWFRPR